MTIRRFRIEQRRFEIIASDYPAVDGVFSFDITGDDETLEPLNGQILARRGGLYTLSFDGRVHNVWVGRKPEGPLLVQYQDRTFEIVKDRPGQGITASLEGEQGVILAEIPGVVISVLASKGQTVQTGEGLVIIEAMKMQNELKAPRAGKILVCQAQKGQKVEAGQLLFEIG